MSRSQQSNRCKDIPIHVPPSTEHTADAIAAGASAIPTGIIFRQNLPNEMQNQMCYQRFQRNIELTAHKGELAGTDDLFVLGVCASLTALSFPLPPMSNECLRLWAWFEDDGISDDMRNWAVMLNEHILTVCSLKDTPRIESKNARSHASSRDGGDASDSFMRLKILDNLKTKTLIHIAKSIGPHRGLNSGSPAR